MCNSRESFCHSSRIGITTWLQMDFGSLTNADRNYVLFCIIITLLQSIVMHIIIEAELHRNRSPPSTLTRAHLFIQAQIDHMLSTIYCRCYLETG